ncbi:MAG: A/G-specific adenine glycosylase [Lentimicrobium sp.]|nr:A/G-specific adenine glycosylase [Lentimicrobium sp.]
MDFSNRIKNWYNINKRDLPWRKTKDPYKVWVSEIILQQTRVDQGLDYYLRFLVRFPDVATLAKASEEDVLMIWKGLGYYSRARNMHFTAREVVAKHKGRFPSDFVSLLDLKGIGNYTAAAISSICGNESRPVVDGNVIRVFSRLFGFHEPVGSTQSNKLVYAKANELIPAKDPGDFNQAVMEFGATQCKPVNPACNECIFRSSCYAYKNDLVDKLPVKKKEIVRRTRFLNYLYIPFPEKGLILYKRTGNDIWENLWELPLYETSEPITIEEMTQSAIWQDLLTNSNARVERTIDFKHVLTHQLIKARFFIVSYESLILAEPDLKRWIIDNPLKSGLPVPRLTERFLQECGCIG